MKLALSLLGTFSVQIDNRTISDFPTQACRGLLAYLMLEYNRAHEREYLAALFWPESPQDQALANLRKTLHRLRTSLGIAEDDNALLIVTRTSIRLNPELEIHSDLASFEANLNLVAGHRHRASWCCDTCLQRLQAAYDCYQGDLLSGFSLDGSACFEEWLIERRDGVQNRFVCMLDALARHHTARSEHLLATRYLRQWLAIEPWCEQAHLHLIKSLWHSGARSAALHQFGRCQAALNEYGAIPSPEICLINQRVLSGEAAPSPTNVAVRLPAPTTPFVGRTNELALLNQHLSNPEHRLITITGLGGVGKTRLAREAAYIKAYIFQDGANWIDLAGLALDEDLVSQVMSALNIASDIGRSDFDQLIHVLAKQERLLIFDNCEHLPGCATFIAKLLQRAPQITILATSRKALELRAERVIMLAGLDIAGDLDKSAAEYSDAGQLFIQAVQRIMPTFNPQPERAMIAALCRQLDGLPFALELAAARTPFSSIADISRAIAGGLKILSTSAADLPDRQRSAYATLLWSWQLLGAREQRLLASLSVFCGGFSGTAVHAVIGAELTTLDDLIRHSLVQRNPLTGRYSMHELVWQFAIEMLPTLSEVPAFSAEHSAYYLGKLAASTQGLRSNGAAEVRARLALDHTNIIQAWRYALENELTDLLTDAMAGLALLASDLGFTQVIELFSAVVVRLGTAQGAAMTLATALDYQAHFLRLSAQHQQARNAAERLIMLAREMNNDHMLARGYLRRAEIACSLRDFAGAWSDLDCIETLSTSQTSPLIRLTLAQCLLQKAHLIDIQQTTPDIRYVWAARAIYQELGNTRDEAIALFRLGNYYRRVGNYAQALQYRYEALTLALKVGDREVEARVRNDLGEDLMHLGCYADACTMLAAAVDLGRALNCLQITAGSLEGLARAHHHLGDQVRAQQCIEEALYLDSSHTLQQMRGYFLTTQGYIFEHMGRHMEAACAYQASLAYWQKHQSAEAALEGQAGLIRLALAHRDQATAAELAKHILPMLTARGLSDALEPMNVYLSCWKALAATKHPHADELLALSYDLLQNQAAQISNPVLRASFLQSISSHRQIVSLFNRNLIAMPISPLLSLMRSEQPRLAI